MIKKFLMNITIDKLVGTKEHFSMEHRILNIVLIFSFVISIWSGITNYLLGLEYLLVLTCIISATVMAILYYLSVVRKKEKIVIFILIISAFTIIPIAWITNGGIAGSIPFYIILVSLMSATILDGHKRFGILCGFVALSGILLFCEYKYPNMVTDYANNAERYIDIFIGLITIIIANSVVYVVIINHYKIENKKAISYLEQSQQVREELLYLSYHDALTGLYNRTYFERVISDYKTKSCVGVFAVDVDGLKFINDTFGHEQGDLILIRAAKVLQSSFSDDDIIARIGGDEFVIIVQDTTINDLEAIYKNIRDILQTENEKLADDYIPLQMSTGYAYCASGESSLRDLLHEADKKMYRGKLYRQSGTEGSTMQTVKKMLSARDHDTGIHSARLQELIEKFAVSAGVPDLEIADIQLFAEFHDVGKIGVPDRVLHKPGTLTDSEREQIQRHCEIGYRIAQSSTDLLPIAEWILKHHEWWNGEGYPLGIKGANIPRECRIVAIADAYDAMTSNRPYRKATSHEAAIDELMRCAGIQFDPELVDVFTRLFHSETEKYVGYRYQART